MPFRSYKTDEKCPNCKVDIFNELEAHVFQEGGVGFDFECPSCNTMLVIEIEPVPAFKISRVNAPQHSVQSDLPKAGEKSEVDELIDRGVCPSCTWRGDVSLENGVCPQCDTNWLALRDSASR